MTRTLSSNDAHSDAYELLRLHTLVENCPDLPKQAREADVAHVEDRLLDEPLFSKITESAGHNGSGWLPLLRSAPHRHPCRKESG